MSPTLAIIVPCYYEEEVLPSTREALLKLLHEAIEAKEAADNSYICFVNDGSQDKTWAMIDEYSRTSPHIQGLNLSRNFGHQGALLAGLFNCEADVYVSIDADLQDDENKIRDMLQEYAKGSDIVYGVRNDRESDTFFKRITAQLFYYLRAKLGSKTIANHADFRLMSRRSVEALRSFSEVNIFMRGIIPLLGYPSVSVYYARKPRLQGESKYPLKKMLKFAWEGIINFSEAPLYLILWLGVVALMCSTLAGFYSIVQWYNGCVVSGWTSLFMTICFFGSLNIIFTGVIGLYMGKVFSETKCRPRFIVQDRTMKMN